MTYLLRLTDGTDTVNLTDKANGTIRYSPRAPETSAVDFVAESLMDGGERLNTTYRNVTESAEMLFDADDITDPIAEMHKVTRLLEQAKEYQRSQAGSRVYVEFAISESAEVYRSEILSGRVEVSEQALQWQHEANMFEAVIIWTRRWYWEGVERELPLSGLNSSRVLGGITVYNHRGHLGAGEQANYVQIDGVDVEGAIPAPVRLTMLNNYVGSSAGDVYVGHNAFTEPETLAYWVQGESAASGTPTADSTASNQQVMGGTGPWANETDLLSWTLPSIQWEKMRSQRFRALLRWTGSTTAIKLRLKIKADAAVIWQGQQYEYSGFNPPRIADVGPIQMPPGRRLPGTAYAMTVTLSVQNSVTGNFLVDFLHFFPMDSFRHLKYLGMQVGNGASIVLDEMTDTIYTDWAANGQVPNYVTYGEKPIRLWPGRTQRLYFLHLDGSNQALPERTLAVQAHYRPRRLSL